MRSRKHQKGFTLLEVVVVILAMILVGLVIYYMQAS